MLYEVITIKSFRQRFVWLPFLMIAAGSVFLIIALARPREKLDESKKVTNGVAIELVIDHSGSIRITSYNVCYTKLLRIIYIKANISIMRNGSSVYTYESEEFKGAGLNWTQANSKGLEKLFEAFGENSEFAAGAQGAFSLD